MSKEIESRLIKIAEALVDQKAAKIIIPAQDPSTGFWFGGGNMIVGPDKALYVVGRYRNFGDSRTGTGAGVRGLEMAIFRSTDQARSWEKVVSMSKADLSTEGYEVLSIEGTALNVTEDGIELFVSTENKRDYPKGIAGYQKPGTGYWAIKHLKAQTVEALSESIIEVVMETDEPSFLHIKDPFLWKNPSGDLVMLFCTHPFNWSSSNTAYAVRQAGQSTFEEPVFEFFPRGFNWDVGITRGTGLLDLPKLGVLADEPNTTLVFYDGGECMRNLDDHKQAVPRPRGYSCEELGGVGYFVDGDLHKIVRLSVLEALLVSPYGTGCSRYVDVLATEDGYHVTWQQCQKDLSQPLVHNFLAKHEIETLLK